MRQRWMQHKKLPKYVEGIKEIGESTDATKRCLFEQSMSLLQRLPRVFISQHQMAICGVHESCR